MLQILIKQVQIDETSTDDLQIQLVNAYAVEEGEVQIKLYTGMLQCLLCRAEQICGDLASMREERVEYYGDCCADFRIFVETSASAPLVEQRSELSDDEQK